MIRCSGQSAFRARAIIAADVDDQRVVEFAHVLDLLDDTANFKIGICGVSGKDFRLARIEFLLDHGKRVPLRDAGRQWSKLGVLRNHAKSLLIGEDLFAQLFITHVELTFKLLDPFLLRLVRRVSAAGHVVDKEWLVRSGRI